MMETILPGSNLERKLVARIRRELGEYVDWSSYYSTPVVKWSWDNCTISTGEDVYKCTPLPYTVKSVAEGIAKYVKSLRELHGSQEGYILLHDYPGSVYELRFIVGEAVKAGAEAVVLVGRGESRAGDSVLSSSIPTLTPDTPPSIPVVVARIDGGMLHELHGKRIRVEVSTYIGEATGETLLLGLHGDSEAEIHVTMHHDGLAWSSSIIDSYIGVIKQILLKARNTGFRPSIVFVSYTAKNTCDRQLFSYTWSWGSRYLLNILESKGLLEKTLLNINIDFHEDPGIRVVDNPIPLASTIGQYSGLETHASHFTLDSLTYLLHGVPAVSLVESIKWVQDNGSSRLVDLAWSTIRHFPSSVTGAGEVLKSLWNGVKQRFSEAPLEYRDLLTRIYESNKVAGDREALRIMVKYTSIVASIYLVNDRMHYCVTHGLYYPLLEDCLKPHMGGRGRILVWGLDGLIIDTSTLISEHALGDLLRRIDSARLIKYNRLFNKILEPIILGKQAGRMLDEQEEHRDR